VEERGIRKQMTARLQALKTERSTWDAHWRRIAEVLLPRSGRWITSDRNRGGDKHNEILDSTGTQALNVMSSGLMAGATSPARPWFRLGSRDPALNKWHSVRAWLDDVGQLMAGVFQRANTYQALRSMYEELGAYGTGACILLPRPGKVIHLSPLTVGEYWLAQDEWNTVNTLYREFDMTVAQVVREFGEDACSESTRNSYRNGRLDHWVTVIHGIEPREDRPMTPGPMGMPWRSVYFEASAGKTHEQVLRESGFERFPALCPRWATTGANIYGNSPGMDVLGDVSALQQMAWRRSQAIDYQTQPPLQAPNSAAGQEQNLLPGGVTYVDAATPQGGVRPVWESRLDLSHLSLEMQETRARIRAGFFADLFLMLASSDRRQMTAAEVAERHEEKLLMLGPVLERLHNELLAPLVETTFDYMADAGMLPPAPPELEGQDLGIEFVSMLAQAQKAIGVNAVDRFLGTMNIMAQSQLEVLDRIDSDELVDGYADMLGVDPDYIVPVEEAQQKRAARDKALAAKEQAAAMQVQASTAKDLAAAPVGGQQQTMLDAIPMVSGYGVPAQ